MQLSAPEISRRRATVEKFQKFLQKCHEDVNKVLDILGWSPDHLTDKASSHVTCPHDAGHVMPRRSLKGHLPTCQLVKKGLSREDAQDVADSSDMFSERPGVVKIDQAKLNGILSQHYLQNHGTGYVKGIPLPLTLEDASVSLSRDERLAVHEYAIQKICDLERSTQKDSLLTGLQSMNTDEKSNEPMSLLEQMAANRDYKRRRQSYRAKNVHTSKKSYTEIIKELISNQMEIFAPPVEEDTKNIKASDIVIKTEPKDSDSEQSTSRYKESLSSRDSPGDQRKRKKHQKHHKHHKHNKHKRHKSDRRKDGSPAETQKEQ